MTIYLFLLGVIVCAEFGLPFLARKFPRLSKILSVVLCAGFLFFLSAFKSTSVGRDTNAYYLAYTTISSQNWKNLSYNNFEKLFVLFCKISSSCGLSFRWFLFIVYLIIYIPFSLVVYKRSPNPAFSFLLFVCWSVLCFDLSGIRQGIAISVLLFSYEALFSGFSSKKRSQKVFFYIIAVALILLMAQVHSSSYIFLLSVLVFFLPVNGRMMCAFITLAIISFVVSGSLFQTLYSFRSSESYLPGSFGGGWLFVAYISIAIALYCLDKRILPIVALDERLALEDSKHSRFFSLYSTWQGEKNPVYSNGLIWFMVISCFIQSFSSVNEVFPRFGWYFLIWMPIAIPIAISRQKSKTNRLLLTVFVSVSFIFFFFFFYLRKDSLSMTPYTFFWQN